jgi:hypothetical protein
MQTRRIFKNLHNMQHKSQQILELISLYKFLLLK